MSGKAPRWSTRCLPSRRAWGFVLAAAIVILAYANGVLGPIDNALFSFRAGLLTRAPTNAVVVVEIDPESLRAAGEWPWPRSRFAHAIENLRHAGATLIGFDVDFSVRSQAGEDRALQSVIDNGPGSIVLPTFIQANGKSENSPLASLAENAILGAVNIPVDRDGHVRRYHRGFRFDDQYNASMAAVLAGAPYGATDEFLIDFGIRLDQIDRLSFESVYRNSFDAARVRGKSVLVGATALEFGDIFSTPRAPATPGVYLHALAFESLVQDRALISLNRLMVVGLGLVVLMIFWPRSGALDTFRLGIRHAMVTAAAILVPLAVQAATPVSIDVAPVLLAQVLCLWAGIKQELSRRAREIVEQREAHLRHAALHDPETGLPNRRAMLEDLVRWLSGRDVGDQRAIIVVAVGIDRFATLRGAIGYANANEIVRRLSERLGEALEGRPIYHLSTSTLGIVLALDDEAQIHPFCADLLGELNLQVTVSGESIQLDVHAGVAERATEDLLAEQMLERATMALDHALAINRRFVIFQKGHIVDPRRQLALLTDIRNGLEKGEFRLVYQPKVSLRNGTLDGAEALIRWTHPVFGPIPPDEFIRVAEQTGAIDDLTRWVLMRAIADGDAIHRAGFDICISVNVSGRSLSSAAFCEEMIARAKEAKTRLCLEITETAIISDPLVAMSSIAAFREVGLKISVDDYGAGLSSLSYLKQISADELKIDRSLVSDLCANARDRLIVKSTIDLAHGLGMSIVAEGIENEATSAVLQMLGCDQIQGYFISRPVPLAELIKFMGEWRTGRAKPVADEERRGALPVRAPLRA